MDETDPEQGHAAEISNLTISIATYRRPELLTLLLEECMAQRRSVAANVRVLVVDNDSSESGRGAAEAFSGVDYLVEAAPGIAAARNCGLRHLRDEDDAVIFIDDDEIPLDGWLKSIISYASSSGADIVTGPVVPVMDPKLPQWIIRGGFWKRARRSTGSTPPSIATNNTLLRVVPWRAANVWFSEALSMKGGSDTEFFQQVLSSGTIVALWCQEAVVAEHVMAERARVRWLFRRAMRIGNINARYRSNMASLIGGLIRIGVGAPYMALDWIVHRHPMARSFNMLAHGIGMIGHVVDRDVVEYERRSGGAG